MCADDDTRGNGASPLVGLSRVIPYVVVDPIEVGPLTLHPFGLLVVIAIVLGTKLAVARA
jgi:hypothetical protein